MGFTFVELVIVIGIVLILVMILVPNFENARSRGRLTSCKSNLKNLATALEMESTDQGGLYAPSLRKLTPRYLKMIPNCPAAGRDSYSATYQVSNPRLGPLKPAFTLHCAGDNHARAGTPMNYPRYSSWHGLIER